MAFRITPAHDPSVQVEFEIPVLDGKGVETLIVFSVPKLHYFPLDVGEKYRAWFTAEQDAGTATDRACTLKLLEMLAPKHYDTLTELTDGEITQISTHWEEASRVNVGESSGSSTS